MRTSVSLLLSLTALFASACPLGDVDRTQPNKIRKSVFDGEWYYHQTVIAAPYTTTFTFIGEQSERTELIRWDIQEKFLIAYRAHDLVAGTDHASALPGDHADNAPVAVFPIESHFDVKREYQPETGEQSNVIVENSWDRPWYERELMRVDWSQNLAPSFSFLVGALPQVPGSHYVQSPGDPDALLLSQRGPDGWRDFQGDSIATLAHAEYLDVVHRVFVTPETLLLEDWDGTLWEEPACWYYGNADCAASEITVRSAFLKRDPDNGYVAKPYPDNEILRDDNGEPIRVSYVDRDSLAPDPDGFVVRVPWFDKFGFFRTERERYDRRQGETHSGRIHLINRFQIWQDAPGCVDEESATPYAGCTVKPIVYYLSAGFPGDLKAEAEATVAGWNEAFQETVRALKYGDARPLSEVEDVVVLRDNTFAHESDKVTDRGQRIGDLRYNLLVWVDQPDQAGLLGYGPAATDPLTGEILQASAFVYGGGVDGYAESGKQIVELIQDPARLYEFLDGEDVMRDVFLRVADDPAPRERTRRFVREKVDTPRNRGIKRLGTRALERDRSELRARLDAIKDTPLEARLMTDEVVRAFGGRRSASASPLSDEERASATPRSWALGQAFRKEKLRQAHLARHNVMHTRAFDPSIIGLAKELEGLPPDEIYRTIRARVFRATAEHEMGHNLGLRHNFEASSDALNYGRAYWDLRGEGGLALEEMTPEQVDAGMRRHQYASIMDYGSRFSSDIEGLGLYDKAAIAFGYGELATVFEGEPDEPLLELYVLDDALRRFRHYTKLPEVFGGIEAMHTRRLVPYARLVDQMAGRASWELWEVPFRFCSDEYEGATATCNAFDEGADAYEIARSARTQYLEYFPFLSFARDQRWFDEYGYLSGVWYRAYLPLLSQYQNWVFDSFFDEGEWECLRSDDEVCDFAPGVADASYYRVEDAPWAEADDGGLPGAAATRLLLDLVGEVLAMPEPGSYYYDDQDEALLLYSYGEEQLCPPGMPRPDCSELNVPFGTGRYTDSVWDTDSGYYFYDRLYMVGSFYDKLLALETAVTSSTYFLGVDSGAELDRFAIGLNLYFPEEVYRLVGGASAEDYPVFAGAACLDTRRYEVPRPTSTDPPCGGGAYQRVDPATSFTVELYAIWYGMAFLQDSFDTAFNDRMKIWLEGGGEAIAPTDPALVVTFMNPLNNRTYHATRTADASAYCPGAALLERAQRFADAYTADPSLENRYRLEGLVSTIEDVRGTYELYGSFWF